MNRARLIDVLLRAGVRLARTPSGALLATAVPPELAALVQELRTDLQLSVAAAGDKAKVTKAGTISGKRHHVWRRCAACGKERLGRHDGKAPSCNLTPDCKGSMLTYSDPEPLTLPCRLPLLGLSSTVTLPVPCARPGCQRPATHLPYWHEPLCQSDFTHLAINLDHWSRQPA